MSDRLAALRLSIADRLCGIEDLLPEHQYKLTLIARHVSNDDAHIVVTADDMDKAVAATGRVGPPPGLPPGPPNPPRPRCRFCGHSYHDHARFTGVCKVGECRCGGYDSGEVA